MAELCNASMDHKQTLCDGGEIKQRTLDEYHETVKRLAKYIGREKLVSDLHPEDFHSLRSKLAKRFGPTRLGSEIQRVRGVFKFGVDSELLDKVPTYGPGFKKPSAKTLRKVRAAGGPRDQKPKQVRALMNHSRPALRAMILSTCVLCSQQPQHHDAPLRQVDVHATVRLRLGVIEGVAGSVPTTKTGILSTEDLRPATELAIG